MIGYVAIVRADEENFRKLNLGLDLGIASVVNGKLSVVLNGRGLNSAEIYAGLLLAAATSGEAHRELSTVSQVFVQNYGKSQPRLVDLSRLDKRDWAAELNRILVETLLPKTEATARHLVSLMKELAQLREEQERTHDSFSRLEQFVSERNLSHRAVSFSLQHGTETSPVLLLPGKLIEQRLPKSSVGLCDFAVFLDECSFDTAGLLSVTLLTAEDNKIHGIWSVPLKLRPAGWLRFSLPTSLSADLLTPTIKIEWNGADALRLRWSVRHPDERFQFAIDGVASGLTLAVRGWSYIAGCSSPIPSDGILPGTARVQSFVAPADYLRDAINLNPDNLHFSYVETEDVLQVHVLQNTVAAALVPGIVRPGTTHVSTRILTRTEFGPVVEYAFALAPAGLIKTKDDITHAIKPTFITSWQALPALVEGELHLYLSDEISEPHDLVLMTRLPEGCVDIAYGWSTFSAICLDMK